MRCRAERRRVRATILRLLRRRGGYASYGELLADAVGVRAAQLDAALFELLERRKVVLDLEQKDESFPIWWVFLPPLPESFPFDERRVPVPP